MRIPEIDLNEDESRIILRFDYNTALVNKVKQLPGARFKAVDKEPDKGEIYWYFKSDVELARMIHDIIEPDMTPRFRKWANEKLRLHRELSALSTGDTATLERLPLINKDLYEMIHLGPKGPYYTKKEREEHLAGDASYQAADVAFMALVPGVINANHPGTGKTIELIAAIEEGELLNGPHLVAAPRSSLYSVWEHWLLELQPHPIYIMPDGRERRIRTMQEVMWLWEEDEPFWLVTNPATLTYDSDFERCADHVGKNGIKKNELRKCARKGGCREEFFPVFPEFEEIEWNSFTLDEFHLAGLGEGNTSTHKGVRGITADKKILMSGTPMGGKIIKLFAALNILDPDEFSSKWRFAEMWLDIVEDHGYKKIESLRKGMEQQFYSMLSTRMIRRTKDEVLPWLPPKQIIDMVVPMTEKQEEQYTEFEDMAEVRIDDYNLSAVGILAEYARLKQFANAVQTVKIIPDPDPDEPPYIELHPTEDSPKLPVIMDLLGERGITGDEDAAGDEQVVIFTESERMASMVYEYLLKHKIPSAKITGPVSTRRRADLQAEFQAPGGPRVMVCTTTAGGVSITLDRASTAIFLDETWNPDDQEQALDRLHRASRIHQVVGYFVRTNATIQQYIQERVLDKSEVNKKVLEFRKRGFFTGKR